MEAAVVIEGETGEKVRVRERECRSLLTRSGLADYCINCYRGCGHGCLYCYARFVTRFDHPREAWGSFVDVRVNAAEVLERELVRHKPGRVFLSSVCDGWQPLEAKYGLTRRCLELLLLNRRFPVTILTKGALAARDLDLLRGRGLWVEFGVTITTLDEGVRRLLEPRASPSPSRLALLEAARRAGVRTYAFLGPLLLGISDGEEALRGLMTVVLEAGVDYFYIDRLNLRHGVWGALAPALQRHFPELLEANRRALFTPEGSRLYSQRLRERAMRVAGCLGVQDRLRFCF